VSKYSFTRELRLLTPSQFRDVFAQPTVVSSPHITLLATPNSLDYPRLGFAVSKKSVKLACRRNLIKRIIRDSFRLKRHEMKSIDIVVVSKRGAGDINNAQMHELIDKLWKRLDRRVKT
jgi:ribonuclease P protein component